MISENWTKAEKILARKAFDLALARQRQKLVDEVNAFRAGSIDDVWMLSEKLKDAAKDMDRTFDFRYSMLWLVFPTLINKGLLTIEELEGLSNDKIAQFKQILGVE